MKTAWLFLFTLSQVFCQDGVCSIDSLLTLLPEESVIPAGSCATFYCFLESHPCGIDRLSNIMWLVNGSLLSEQNDHVSMRVTSFDAEVIGSLEFVNVPATYDITELQCVANIPSTANIHSNIAELIVLEDVPVVDDLTVSVQGSVFSLHWTVSPSTPNTTFCAEMSRSSPGNNINIDSKCDIRATAHEFEIPPRRFCNHFFFYVTPMNEFHTGTRTETSYTQDVDIPTYTTETHQSEFRTAIVNVTLVMSDPVCSGDVTFEDREGERIRMEGAELNITGTNITINSHSNNLTSDLYNITVVAQNIAGSGTSSAKLDLRNSPTSNLGNSTTSTEPAVTIGIIVGVVMMLYLMFVVVLAIIIITYGKRSKKNKIWKIYQQDTEDNHSNPDQDFPTPIHQYSTSNGMYADKAHPEITEEDHIGPDFAESTFFRDGKTERSHTQQDDSQQPLTFGNQVSAAAGGDAVEEEASQD